uniref:NADH-ubiquinone oxidoreductase chain 2 n=2 Tax=Protohermes TaxID=508444 RepID=B6RZV5_9NEOP|nr:NADH dehydrogenase subunit 2 [Protohermes concolorus]ACA51944.1 NADH dehydrogenase subunit 2 [Protohermes concolorus]UFZ12943.1 NADH dehydrogenase subunit 2 [Protohermes concolorus]
MIFNLSKLVFLFCLASGTLISISSNSWLGAWMGLEINLLCFIPLMSNSNNMISNESALKYFLAQALASSVLLFSIIISSLSEGNLFFSEIINISQIMLMSALLLKLGAAPFHFWFPSVMEGLDWINGLILMTWQKIAPLVLLTYNYNASFMNSIVIFCLFTGAIGGLNQTNLRSLMAYSSINHLGWILSSMMISSSMWITYFSFYVFLSLTIILIFLNFKIYSFIQINSLMNSTPMNKFILFSNLLSMGGLPPFLGFFPKLLVIQNLIFSNNLFLIFCMVMSALITLFFYIRLSFSSFMIMSINLKWYKSNYLSNKFLYFLNSISLLGLIFIILFYSYL